jgi:hypothetical protein
VSEAAKLSHEQEVRPIYYDSDAAAQLTGILPALSRPKIHFSFPIELRKLIESVWISPKSGKWLVDPLRALFTKFELSDIPVEHSSLYDPVVE